MSRTAKAPVYGTESPKIQRKHPLACTHPNPLPLVITDTRKGLSQAPPQAAENQTMSDTERLYHVLQESRCPVNLEGV